MISCLAGDVDAARGLVEDQQARLGGQPARHQALLLVAARQRADGRVDAGALLMPSARDAAVGAARVCCCARELAPQAHARLQRQHDVLAHRQLGHDAFGLALFRAQRQALRHRRRPDRRSRTASPSMRISPASGAVESEQQPRQLGAARAEQAAEAQHFAGADLAGRPAAMRRAGPRPRASEHQRRVAASTAGSAPPAPLSLRHSRPTIAATSAAAASSAARYSPTSAPLRSTVMRSRHRIHLVQEMRDEQDGHASSRKPAHHREQLLALRRSSRLEVGSSRISTRAETPSARAIATICCTATGVAAELAVDVDVQRPAAPAVARARVQLLPVDADQPRVQALRG